MERSESLKTAAFSGYVCAPCVKWHEAEMPPDWRHLSNERSRIGREARPSGQRCQFRTRSPGRDSASACR